MNFHKGRQLYVKGSYIDKTGARRLVNAPDARPGAMLIFIELITLFPSEELNEASLKTQFAAL
jgi:hypothetical protein